MPDYSKGQIYKITDVGQTKCYVGSTTQQLCYRMAGHRRKYNSYLEGKIGFDNSVFYLFDEFGVETCKIVWIKDFACNSKKELEAEEGRIQQETECVNKRMEGRTPEQYRRDKKDDIFIRNKNYRENHKEREQKRKSNWYYRNKMKCNVRSSEDYINNREERLKQSKERYEKLKLIKYTCGCGSTIPCIKQKAHEKTLKHQQYLQNLNNPQE